ncbi:MAG: tRNA-i(6)A37 methylthiotransferase, partial [uncultured Thermoleophilia bacterium]
APVPPDDLRLPDERARLGAHQGPARVLGTRRGRVAGRGGRDRLQHLHDPREGGRSLPPEPDARARSEGSRSGEADRGRRLLVRVAEGRAVRRVPVRRLRVRAGLHRPARRLPGARRRAATWALLDLRRVRGRPADAPRPPLLGVAADLDGLQLRVLVLHRAGRPRSRALATARGRAVGGAAPGRRRRLRADAARAERQLLRARPAAHRACLLRRAAAPARRRAGDRPDPVHEPTPEGHACRRDRRHGGVPGRLRGPPPAAAVGLDADPQGDAAYLLQGALPGARRPAARRDARRRADHRHHRRVPRRDGGRLRRHPRRLRHGRVRPRVHLHLLAAARHRGGGHGRPGPRAGQARAPRTARGARAGPRPTPERPAGRIGAGGARGGAEPHRPGHPPRPRPLRQDGHLLARRRRGRRRAGARRGRHVADAARDRGGARRGGV